MVRRKGGARPFFFLCVDASLSQSVSHTHSRTNTLAPSLPLGVCCCYQEIGKNKFRAAHTQPKCLVRVQQAAKRLKLGCRCLRQGRQKLFAGNPRVVCVGFQNKGGAGGGVSKGRRGKKKLGARCHRPCEKAQQRKSQRALGSAGRGIKR
jgi:hypothetical protein